MVIEVPDGIRHGETERLSDPDQQVRNYRHWNYSDSAPQTVSCFFAINFFASSKTLSS